MNLSQLELDAIAAEINNDPNAIGYVVTSGTLIDNPGADPEINLQNQRLIKQAQGATLDDVVDKLNADSGEVIPRGPASTADIIAAAGDVSSLTTDQTTKYNTLLLMQSVDMSNVDNQALVDAAFPVATKAAQNASLKALTNRTNGSRSEAIIGKSITRQQVAKALYGVNA